MSLRARRGDWPLSLGLSITQWKERLQNVTGLSELFDRETGGNHQAHTWTQFIWERNRENVKRNVRRILASEFVSPA